MINKSKHEPNSLQANNDADPLMKQNSDSQTSMKIRSRLGKNLAWQTQNFLVLLHKVA